VSNPLAARAGRYYAAKLREHGPTPRGVDWNDEHSQRIRFDKLLEVVGDTDGHFSINDYGCGYGALVGRLRDVYGSFTYTGFDVSEEMVAEAERLYAGEARARFTSDRSVVRRADFTVASGVFNVKEEALDDDWRRYVVETLGDLAALSSKGFAFNALTSHADPERRRLDLFYADPADMLDHCLGSYARDVVLLHDYELYEFTLIVRLDGRPPAVVRSG
jgi:hypothetical protein